jgi:adenylate cyclase
MLKGFDEPIEIREAGFEGLTSFLAPMANEKAAPLLDRSSPWLHRHRVPAVVSSLAIVGALLAYLAWPDMLRIGTGPNVAEVRQTVSGLANVPNFDGRPAIAVLPFDNLSPDPDQAFFADGLAEDLITRLASWRAFPVIARNSSFQYRGGNLDMTRVGDELGVRYLVEGSVRRAGDQIRVTAQLIDAASGEHVWAETYDRAISDLFSLQDEISSTIAASLVGDLTRAEGARAHRQETGNLEAWSLYQLGLDYADRYTRDDSLKAARFFKLALALDPRFAAASAQLAMTNWMILTGDGNVATADQIAAAFETARRALEIDPRDPVAHAALGAIYLTAGDPQNALDATRRAVELNPSMPLAWIWFGFAQVLAGNPQACIAATERAQRLDPHGPTTWIYDSLALANWEAGDYDASLTAGRRLVAAHPTYFTGYLYVAMSAVSLGRIDEARDAIEEGRRVRPDLSIELMQNYLAVSRPAIDARRNTALRKAGLD